MMVRMRTSGPEYERRQLPLHNVQQFGKKKCQHQNKIKNFYLKCEVCTPIWFGDMTDDQDDHQQNPSFHQSVPSENSENLLAGCDHKRRTSQTNKSASNPSGHIKIKWSWMGHQLRRGPESVPKNATEWNTQGYQR